jgi:hypothetical protein
MPVPEAKSPNYEGLHLCEPGQFLHNALPRARAFLDRVAPTHTEFREMRDEPAGYT